MTPKSPLAENTKSKMDQSPCAILKRAAEVLGPRAKAYGRFPPWTRYSGDQVPLPFIVGNSETFEDQGATAVEISQPSDGLEKRQATIHLIFRGVWMEPAAAGASKRMGRVPLESLKAAIAQPRAVLVFRGQGKVKDEEKAAWDPRVDVYFQKNAWVDRKVASDITKKTWARHVRENHTDAAGVVDETLMLLDNLDAQTYLPFVAELLEGTWEVPPIQQNGFSDLSRLWLPYMVVW